MRKINCWVCNSQKITIINLVSNTKIKHFVCDKCYFLFSNNTLGKNKKINYYSNNSKDNVLNRYISNEYFDTARFLNYINLILNKNCKLSNKINHLDIGGGFGFFSKVLKKKFSKINSFNLEPDKYAFQIANKINTEIKTLNLRFEDVKILKNIKFDLVTYWGGIYRTIKPDSVIKDLKKICTKNCDFFFSLPSSFEDMRMQHLDLKNSFDEYLYKNDGNQSLFGKNHMKLFLLKNKFFFKEIFIQNKPFKKIIPVFHFKLKNKKNKIPIISSKFKADFKKNISMYNDYFENQIYKIIKNKKKSKKIFIFGENFLTEYVHNFLKKKIKNLIYIKNNSKELYKNTTELKTILNLSNQNSNVFLIFENSKDNKIKTSLINRLHLSTNNNLYFLKDKFTPQLDVCYFSNMVIFKRKITLIKSPIEQDNHKL